MDRRRAVLTKDDREFLQGRLNYDNAQLERGRRHNIRNRVLDGLKDFDFLSNRLALKDLRQILESSEEDVIDDLVEFYAAGLADLECKEYRETVAEIMLMEDTEVDKVVFDLEDGKEVYDRQYFGNEIDTDEFYLASGPTSFESFDYKPKYHKTLGQD